MSPLLRSVSCLFIATALAAGEAPAAASTALSVSVVRLVPAGWPVLLRADGEIAAWQEALVACATGGLRLTELKAEVGDRVQAGQELAVVDTAALRAQVQAQEGELVQAEAALATAIEDVRRLDTLRKSQAITAQQETQYLSVERGARGRVATVRAQLEIQRLALERARVIAPDDGVVIAREAVLGQVPQAGAVLFRLIRQGRLEWRAEVLVADLASIKAGQEATIALPGGGRSDGVVRSIAPTISTRTRTATVFVDLSAGAAQAGMFVSGEIAVEAGTPAMALPAAAVVQRDGRSLVFAVDVADRVRERRVQVGRRRGEQVEILAGVEADARIVAAGGAFLAEGDRVAVVQP